ncbi:toprim domain-containing protein [Vibrio alfacsensis]|uniref:toprim domain-containing protein n=1 Tax=Vibrio alfacsensis TaxID=1074311 RepID=UPI004067F746
MGSENHIQSGITHCPTGERKMSFWDVNGVDQRTKNQPQPEKTTQPTRTSKESKGAYVENALNAIYDNLSNASEGDRNGALFREAANAYEFVAGGHALESEVTSSLGNIADGLGLSADEVKTTLKSARAKAVKNPRTLPEETPIYNPSAFIKAAESEPKDNIYALSQLEKFISNSAKNHEYLINKKLNHQHGFFFTGWDKGGNFLGHKLYNKDFEIVGYERIYSDRKMVSSGASSKGVYFGAFRSVEKTDTCYITEGAADALSILEVTKCDSYSATSAGNLEKVANIMRDRYKRVIIALDNDPAGQKVAEKLSGKFECVMPSKEKDYSDVFTSGGDVLAELQNKPKIASQKKEEIRQGKQGESITALNLEQFAITNTEEMRNLLANDNWILDRLALQGQITIIFAKPNSGKTLLTLRMLIDSVKSGSVSGEDVFYLNSDDTMRGLITKAEIAAQYGIRMLASGYNGFKNSHLTGLLEQLTDRDEANGKVLILDTLKKFSDLMNKTESSAFNEIMRGFVSKGGTVIALAHTNKSRDADGKVVFQGTSDTVDDADCCYTLDVVNVVEDSFQGMKISTRTVLFENFKARGDNVDKVSYQYNKIEGEPYQALLESVKAVDERETARAEKQGRINQKLADNEEEIQLVLDALEVGINTTEKIIQFLMNEGIARAKAKKVLKEHTGSNVSEGHRWLKEKGEKNERIFKRLS